MLNKLLYNVVGKQYDLNYADKVCEDPNMADHPQFPKKCGTEVDQIDSADNFFGFHEEGNFILIQLDLIILNDIFCIN